MLARAPCSSVPSSDGLTRTIQNQATPSLGFASHADDQILPRPRQWIARHRPNHDPLHFATADFDALIRVEHVGSRAIAPAFSCRSKIGHAPSHAHTNMMPRNRVRVTPTRGQMRLGEIQLTVVERAELVFRSLGCNKSAAQAHPLPVCPPANNNVLCASPRVNRAGCSRVAALCRSGCLVLQKGAVSSVRPRISLLENSCPADVRHKIPTQPATR